MSTITTDERVAELELRVHRTERRLRALEAPMPAAGRPGVTAVGLPHGVLPQNPAGRPGTVPGPWNLRAGPSPHPDRPTPAPCSAGAAIPAAAAPAAPRPSLEDLLGGRALAWAGGAAVLIGLALLFALGVSNGWIGEGARCLLGGLSCLGLLGAGVRLHDHAGRTEAARTAVAVGLAGLFLTLTVATSAYALLPAAAGILGAGVVGTLGTALAIRWASPVVGSIGLVGALLAPVLGGIGAQPESLPYLAVATLAAVAVLVWQRWAWLSLCVGLVATPQWLLWLGDADPSVVELLAVLVAFGTLGAVAAVGSALRAPGEPLRTLPAALLAINALILALAGWDALDVGEGSGAATGWLAGLAVVHLGLGLRLRNLQRVAPGIGVLCLAIGVLLVDVAFSLLTDGLPLLAGWALGVIAFAALARQAGQDARDRTAAGAGLGLHVALALTTTLPQLDAGDLLGGGTPGLGAAAGLGILAGACLISARLAPRHRLVLDVTGLLAAAGLVGLCLDGVALTATWALQGAALCRLGVRDDDVAWGAGLLHLAAAAVWWLVDQAPPTGLVDGLADPAAAGLGFLAIALAGARVVRLTEPEDRAVAVGALAAATLFLASTAAVTLGGPGGGQLALSALWAGVGVVALLIGLRADIAAVRTVALALLGGTIGKVFVVDLATMEASARVAAFLGLGILLLGAAFAWQRLRPEAPRDLREVPGALR